MTKKEFKTTLLASFVGATTLTGCLSESVEPSPAQGMARLSLKLNADAGFAAQTRALSEDAWKNLGNYTVEITNSSFETVNTYAGNALPTEALELPTGTYRIHAYYGSEQVSSRSEFLCEGEDNINLGDGDSKNVSIKCQPTCGKVKVAFRDDMSDYYSDYFVTFTTPKMSDGTFATWSKNDTEPWYFAVGKNGDEVVATIHLTVNSKYTTDKTLTNGMTVEGTVVAKYTLKRNYAWTLNVAPQYTSSSGTLGITVTIDKDTNDVDEYIVIPSEWL